MTEAEWLGCTDPKPMLVVLAEKANERKLRLFGCACCRRISRFVSDTRFEEVMTDLELYADGVAKAAQRLQARKVELNPAPGVNPSSVALLHFEIYRLARKTIHRVAKNRVARNLGDASSEAVGVSDIHYFHLRMSEEKRQQVALLRDIFGNPFRPVAADPSWLAWNNSTVVKLAHGIYDDRAFDRLPVLADALEEAGCHDADILGHCRQQGAVHVRGCWVVDLLTGRS